MTQVRYRPRTSTTRIILHDSHTPPHEDASDWASKARDGGLKMGLLGTGYHYVIERDGRVVETREHTLVGTHTPGHNMDSIGVCLVGGRSHEGGQEDNFTDAQRLGLFGLLHHLRAAHGPLAIKGHTEVQRYRNRNLPPCPPIDMDDLRQDFEVYLLERQQAN